MLRYYLIATAIVLAVGCIAAALHFGGGRALRVASVQTTASPSPPRTQSASTFEPGAITGTAPWAFSALTDCFHQERTFHGTLGHVRRQLPLDAHPLAAGAILRSGPCRVYLEGDYARALRGPAANPSVDVRIPPHLRVYVQGSPAEAETFARRRIFVLRWEAADEARLDRLSTMPDARLHVGG